MRLKKYHLWTVLLGLIIFLSSISPASGYIGPGAGFAFLSSFLVLFLTFLAAFFSLLAWPFRLLFRLLKGQRAFRHSQTRRLVIIGLDGFDPELTDKFMAAGRLPHLAELKKKGSYYRLKTTTPAISPVAWSSFMTGCEPSKHNIFDFLSRDARTYLPTLSSARILPPRRRLRLGRKFLPLGKPVIQGFRRSLPFWKILGDKGIPGTILRVPITFPPEKFRGHLLSGMCAPDLKGSQGTFSFYTSDPQRLNEKESGVTIPVEIRNGLIDTYISGPENSLENGGEARLPLKIWLKPKTQEAVVEVSGQRFTLRPGVFSPWIRLTFSLGLGIKVQAIARFYLSSLEPYFNLYLTPLNIDPEKPALPISHPFYYSIYLSKLLGPFITLGEANDTWALNEGALPEKAFLDLTYSNHEEWERMLFNALKKRRQGVIACVFETTDSIQHMFWRYLEKNHPALTMGSAQLGPEVIEELYGRMDGLVGRVMNYLQPKDKLIVMSDHGFKSFRRGVNLNSWLYREGYLKLREGCQESQPWFKDVDWDKTQAYALGLGGLYLNLRGRETKGIVTAGEEAKRIKGELKAKLKGLKDEATGETAILEVYDRDEIYSGPYRENAPDLIIGYNKGYRASWDGVTGKVNSIIFEPNVKAWSGDHCIDPSQVPGVIFTNFPLNSATPSILDIAPTVLELFGVAPPAHMDGHSLLVKKERVAPAQAKPVLQAKPKKKANEKT
jgi:predicted AlkP superfamily phosphohydrolase/phosphomutase